MEIVLILIAVLISSGIAIALRYMDRDSNQMEKVKRYADKRQTELGKFFEERYQSLRADTATLETKLSQAQATVKRLDLEMKDYQKIILGVQKDKAAAQEVEKKIAEYGRAITELSQMTEAVEENLKRVKNEGVVIDKVRANIKENQDSIEKLSKRIPTVVDNFKEANAGQLRMVGADLLKKIDERIADMKARADEIDGTTKSALKQNETVLKNLNASVDGIYSTAAEKVKKLEDEAFKRLNEQATKRAEDYKAEVRKTGQQMVNDFSADFNTQLANIKQNVEKSIGGIKKSVSDYVAELKTSTNSSLSEIKTTMNATLAETKKTTAELAKESAGNGKSLETIRSQLEGQSAALQQKYDNMYLELTQKIEAKEKSAYEKYAEAAKLNIENYKNSVAEKVESYKASIVEKVTAMQDSIKQSVAELKEYGANVSRTTKSEIAELKSAGTTAIAEAKETRKTIENWNTTIDQNILEFEKSSNSRIDEISKRLEAAVKAAIASYDARQINAMTELDADLEKYKKDMLYRFSRLESSGSDVDRLEGTLRKSMSETQKRVLEDFKNFAAKIHADSAALSTQIQTIEDTMEDLRKQAIARTSEKLSTFENTFEVDLKKRGDTIDEALNAWKQGFDDKIAKFQTDYENDRIEIEEKYNDAVKARLAAIEKKSEEQIKKTALNVQENQSNIKAQIEDARALLKEFTKTYQAEIKESLGAADATLQEQTKKQALQISENLSKLKDAVVADLEKFKKDSETQRQLSVATIDTALQDFTSWKEKFDRQFEAANKLFQDDLSNFRDTSTTRTRDMQTMLIDSLDDFKKNFLIRQQEIINSVDDFKESVDDKHKEIEEIVTELDNRASTSLDEYQEKADSILSELQDMYEKMLESTEARVRNQNDSAEKKIRSLSEELERTSNEDRKRHTELLLQMQNDSNDLQMDISDLAKELNAVKAQMQNYDKAEDMKRQLNSYMEDIKENFARLKDFQKTADIYNKNYDMLVKLDEDALDRIDALKAGQNQLNELERDYNRLLALAGTMEQKTKNLQDTNDDLQSLEVKVRQFKDDLAGLSVKYDRIDKKSETIDQVSGDVDTAFENLKELEKRLENCARQVMSLPDEIKDAQDDVDKLMENTKRINQAIDKLDSLKEILDDTEKRIAKVERDREGIVSSEERLNKLSKNIDTKFNALEDITKADTKKKSKRSSSISPRTRDSVKELKRQGWRIEEIAANLKLSEGEVQLILDMPD